MKNILSFLLLFVTVSCFTVATAQDFPAKPSQLVNDYTRTLSTAEVQRLEQKLVTFADSASTQIAVVVMQSTGEYDIADYGVRLAQQWGIGSKENSNGILLLVALGDRAVTIQTGYGVEGAIPDVTAHRIIEDEIKPAFRRGEYYTGINDATDALISYTKGEYKASGRNSGKGGSGGILLIVIVVFVLIAFLGRRGGGGNGGGQILGRGGASDLLWWGMLGGLGRGGNSGGGGFGGFGGGSGGGFGGFGGGGFGGGGASGRW